MSMVDACRRQRPGEVDLAAAVLGDDHPLVRALDRLAVVTKQSMAVGGLASAAAVGAVIGVPGSLPVLVAAVVVGAALAAAHVALAAAKRDRAIDVILAGRGETALPAVEHERRRLTDPRRRRDLADWLETVRRPEPWAAGRVRPLFTAHLIAAVAPDLAELASRLRAGVGDARGIARIERLLSEGGSALYGLEVEPLRSELHRILLLLAD